MFYAFVGLAGNLLSVCLYLFSSFLRVWLLTSSF